MGQLFPIGKRITRTGLIGLVGFTLNDSLSVKRRDLSATTVGDYALFGGGLTNDYEVTVDGSSATVNGYIVI